jgi:hypothetical protein
MEGRGRASAASLAVVGPVDVVQRPKPPAELTPEQAQEWNQVVAGLPAEWFGRETHAMLAQYCRHVVASRRVSQLILDFEHTEGQMDVELYDRLLKMQEREGRAMSALATRMRISQQTTYDKSKRKRASGGARPWDAKPGGES